MGSRGKFLDAEVPQRCSKQLIELHDHIELAGPDATFRVRLQLVRGLVVVEPLRRKAAQGARLLSKSSSVRASNAFDRTVYVRNRSRLMATTKQHTKTSRIELRASDGDRELLDRAAAVIGTDRSSFLLNQGRLAAQRVLANREQFVLDQLGLEEWERINNGPARNLTGLIRLLQRPSPFHPQA